MELKNLLRNVELFSGLNDDQLDRLAQIFEQREYQAGETLFSHGDEAARLYLVRAGFVEVIGPDGRALVQLGPGQSVGEMALVDQGARSATVRAVSDHTMIASMSREQFDQFCESDPATGYRIMRNIAADLSFRLRRRTMEQR